MVADVPSKVVNIGGIPFDQTEEQVLEIARSVGPVQKIQLIIEKETGKSKGYAFVKYNDEETASSAVRNLSSYTIGNRVLKCTFANESSLLDPFGNQGSTQAHQQQASSNNSKNNNGFNNNREKNQSIPPLPPGVDVYNEKPGDAITRSLQKIDQGRLSNIVKESIRMAKTNPKLMEELLIRTPQLSYAIVQASLMVNAVTESDLAGLVKEIPEDMVEPQLAEPVPMTEEQKDLLRQVISLSEAEINSLPDDQKKVVYQLKGQYIGSI